MKQLKITEFEVGERLDKALATALPKHSRSSLEKLIDGGFIVVNSEKVKSGYKLKASDEILVDLSPFKPSATKLEIPIIFENEDVLVLDKPVGVLTHSKGELNNEATIASFIKPYLKGSEAWKSNNRAGIVHRLDRATSGIIITAKTEAAQGHLQKQFAKRNVKKTYNAVVSGRMPEDEGIIDLPIERNPKNPATFRVGSGGKGAQTYFKVLKTKSSLKLLELKPTTGRTHQLRVHLKYLNCPIVGDTVYDGQPNNRLLLHALSLEVTLPGSSRQTFKAKLPPEFKL